MLLTMLCDDGTMPDDWPLKRLMDDLYDCAEQIGRSLRCAETYKQALINVGFVDVQQITYKLPINNWPRDRKWKEMGSMWKGIFEGGGLQAISMGLLHRVRGLNREQIEVSRHPMLSQGTRHVEGANDRVQLHLVECRRALQDTSVHAYEK